MFPTRYFANRYFAPRYFPKVGAAAAAAAAFWCALTGMSGMTGGGDLEDLG